MTLITAILLAVLLLLFANDYQQETFQNTVLTQIATVIISVACSIIASLMWAKIDKEQPQNINFSEIIAQLNLVERAKFAPTKIYSGANITHDEFNKKLNQKIEKTKKYSYMGDKAKYLAKRLSRDITITHNKLTRCAR